MVVRVQGYWCAVVARDPRTAEEWFLGGHRASAPHLAVRWLRAQAARLAEALDPRPEDGVFPVACLERAGPGHPDPGALLRTWMEDFRYQGMQLQALAAGSHISVSVEVPDRTIGFPEADVCYALSARPIAVASPEPLLLPRPAAPLPRPRPAAPLPLPRPAASRFTGLLRR